METINYYFNKYKFEYLDTLVSKTTFKHKIIPTELYDEKTKGINFVLYENLICDVGPFMNRHPGGKNIIGSNLYTDVGRYLSGTQGYSSKVDSNNHNYFTIRYLIQKLAYAELIQDTNILINITDRSKNFERNLKITSKKEVARNVFEYKFVDKNYQFAKFLTGHTWLGRHFTISNSYIGKTRYYTLSLAMDYSYRKRLNILMDNMLKGIALNSNMEYKLEERHADYLCFYIKRYKYPDALSNVLWEESSEFKVKGPMV
jgi:hypothetical protein